MEFSDFLVWKMIALGVVAFFLGLAGVFKSPGAGPKGGKRR